MNERDTNTTTEGLGTVETELTVTRKPTEKAGDFDESYYLASQWQLMWRNFRKHRLALVGIVLLAILYLSAAFAGFLSPYDIHQRHRGMTYAPPQRIRFIDTTDGLKIGPFVYGWTTEADPVTWEQIYVVDKTLRHPIRFFVRSHEYRFLGLIPTDIHFFGVEEGTVFLFGTDEWGRDLFSRILHAARISLSIGLVGIAVSFILGCLLGGLSGFFGGTTDLIIQRVIELLLSIPTIPFWMALAAALPMDWTTIQVYFAITIILALRGWTNLARVVRGKLLSLREEDFVVAAKLCGVGEWKIIATHLLPSFMSYLIVSLTLSVPYMILGETSLSFLGLGLRPPAVSWGVLLQQAQSIRVVAINPWLLIPAIFVIVTVLAFNFVGDGLRDAADPYK